jgi:hypothetical protein
MFVVFPILTKFLAAMIIFGLVGIWSLSAVSFAFAFSRH